MSALAAALPSPAASASPAEYRAVNLLPSGYQSGQFVGPSVGFARPFGVSPSGWQLDHAAVWSGSAAAFVDLHPAGYVGSGVWGAAGGQQAGFAVVQEGGPVHAMVWSGSRATAVDLHVPRFYSTFATGTSGTRQVGSGTFADVANQRALVWSGSAASAVDITPPGYAYADARGIFGSRVVGEAEGHAILWDLDAGTFVDLEPTSGPLGHRSSSASAVWGDQQVGRIGVHAALWTGSAESAVDLHPAGFDESEALAVANGRQAGYGVPSGQPPGPQWQHALVWSGTAETVTDLHQFLPPGYMHSVAQAIDPDGTVYGWAYVPDANAQPFMWVPVPEPSAAGLLAPAALGLLARRMRLPRQPRQPSRRGWKPDGNWDGDGSGFLVT